MKKLYSLLIVFVLVCGILLSGCSICLNGGPALTDGVSSNGGLCVRKGNYLYFVNGFQSYSELAGSDNNYGEVKQSGIYRAKVNSDGEISYDEDGKMQDVELLLPQVVGYEYTGLYIFGNKIYYTTPTTLKDSAGTIRFDLVDFCCANLNGTGVKKLYGAQNWESGKSNYNYTKIDGYIYLTVFDGQKLISLKINDGNVVYTKQIAEGVSSVAYDKFVAYNAATGESASVSNNIYYTRNLTEDDFATNGNVLEVLALTSGTSSKLVMDNSSTYVCKQLNNNIFYYTQQGINEGNAYWYYKDLSNQSFANAQAVKLTEISYTDVVPLEFESGNNRGVIVNTGSKLKWLKNVGNMADYIELSSTVLTSIVLVGDDIVGFDSEGALYKLNIQTKLLTKLSGEEDALKFDTAVAGLIDYDNYFLYFYKQYTGADDASAYYLARIDLSKSVIEVELLGTLLDEHVAENDIEE